jgi:hypothetical protein
MWTHSIPDCRSTNVTPSERWTRDVERCLTWSLFRATDPAQEPHLRNAVFDAEIHLRATKADYAAAFGSTSGLRADTAHASEAS